MKSKEIQPIPVREFWWWQQFYWTQAMLSNRYVINEPTEALHKLLKKEALKYRKIIEYCPSIQEMEDLCSKRIQAREKTSFSCYCCSFSHSLIFNPPVLYFYLKYRLSQRLAKYFKDISVLRLHNVHHNLFHQHNILGLVHVHCLPKSWARKLLPEQSSKQLGKEQHL